MTPLEIKIELMRAGITQADIARRAGVSRQAVYIALKNGRPMPRVKQAIAAALGLTVDQVFPPQEKSLRNQRSNSIYYQND